MSHDHCAAVLVVRFTQRMVPIPCVNRTTSLLIWWADSPDVWEPSVRIRPLARGQEHVGDGAAQHFVAADGFVPPGEAVAIGADAVAAGRQGRIPVPVHADIAGPVQPPSAVVT